MPDKDKGICAHPACTCPVPEGEKYWASPLIAEGRMYLVSQKGTVTVLQLSDTEPEVLAVNAMKDTILASPVASDGALFLRSDRYLYCIGDKR